MKFRPVFLSLVAACSPKPAAEDVHNGSHLEHDAGAIAPKAEDAGAPLRESETTKPNADSVSAKEEVDASAARSLPKPDAFPRVKALGGGLLARFGASYVALRESGNQRASFGGARGEGVNGPIGPSFGGGCESEIARMKGEFNTGRKVLACQKGKLSALDPFWQGGTVLSMADSGFMKAVRAVDSPDVAILLAWVSGYFHIDELRAGVPIRAVPGGFELYATSFGGCYGEVVSHTLLRVSRTGDLEALASDAPRGKVEHCMPLGRRPEGFVCDEVANDLEEYCARAERLERVSVIAFERLGDELERHAAPARLVEAARRAARDEVRHARHMNRLLRRTRRGSISRSDVTGATKGTEARGLAAMLEENAIEGCILETYAALLATHQSVHAEDAPFRRTIHRIARDETRHAELAWAVHHWGMALLTGEERCTIRAKQQRTLADLRARAIGARDPLRRLVGEPSTPVHRRLVSGLAQELGLDR